MRWNCPANPCHFSSRNWLESFVQLYFCHVDSLFLKVWFEGFVIRDQIVGVSRNCVVWRICRLESNRRRLLQISTFGISSRFQMKTLKKANFEATFHIICTMRLIWTRLPAYIPNITSNLQKDLANLTKRILYGRLHLLECILQQIYFKGMYFVVIISFSKYAVKPLLCNSLVLQVKYV